jgi:hypothetical protein
MIKNQIFKFMKIFKFAFSPHPKKMHPEILAHCHHGSSQVGNTPVPGHGPGLDTTHWPQRVMTEAISYQKT